MFLIIFCTKLEIRLPVKFKMKLTFTYNFNFIFKVSAGFGGLDAIGTTFMSTWDPYQGVLNSNAFPTFHHSAQVNALELINATHLASGSDDSTLKVWDLATGTCSLTINTQEKIKALKLLSSGFLAGGGDGSFDIYVWSLTNGSIVKRLAAHNDKINTIVVLKNGDFATGSDDQRVIVWSFNFTKRFTLIAADAINCIKQLPNGNLAGVINHFKDNFYVWNLGSLTHSVINAHTKPARSVEVLSNGHIATSSDDLSIRIWSADNLSLVFTLHGHKQSIRVLKLLPNGFLASGSDDSLIKIWNTTNGTHVRDLQSPKNIKIKYLALEVLANMSAILFIQNQTTSSISAEYKTFDTSSAKNEFQISTNSDLYKIETVLTDDITGSSSTFAGAISNEMLESTDSYNSEKESSTAMDNSTESSLTTERALLSSTTIITSQEAV